MPKAAKEHDFVTIARNVVEKAVGERLDGSVLTDPNQGKSPVAIDRGRKGGLKGGKARAAKLSPRKRKAIAVKAAEARWNK